MTDRSPFTPTQTASKVVAAEATQRTDVRAIEILHSVFRGLFAFFCFGIGPIFIVPVFKRWFEEFGIELPSITEWVIQLSGQAIQLVVLYLPLAIGVFAGAELSILTIRSSGWKRRANIVYWLILAFAIGFMCLSLAIPCYSIIEGLYSTIVLTPR